MVSFLLAPVAVSVAAAKPSNQQSRPQDEPGLPPSPDKDERLPNGKSQRDEIARHEHADALKDADALVEAAEALRDELKRAGNYTVPVSSVRKTEEIEKLARRIRGRLKN
jgi:hypothetical protein